MFCGHMRATFDDVAKINWNTTTYVGVLTSIIPLLIADIDTSIRKK